MIERDGLVAEILNKSSIFRDTKCSKIVFVDGAQIGSRLDRGPGRPVHSESHTDKLWGSLGGWVMNDFLGESGGQRSLGSAICT